ncbi:arsenosugar biosynthesis radical SAM (seleno)protein ArsS [Elusimicrobiota bacterium]
MQHQLSIIDSIGGIEAFSERIRGSRHYPLSSKNVEILQMNIGKRCNLVCKHCHVDAGPQRREFMLRDIMQCCLDVIAAHRDITTIDITGGSPEMNPDLPWLLNKASCLKKRLMVRTNLVIMCEEQFRDYPDLYAQNSVEIIASLPDFNHERSDRQRGTDTFRKSIQMIEKLNRLGYGRDKNSLILNLVHNPVGAYLPGFQQALEFEYKKKLSSEYGICFNNLFCITNMPIGRYLEYLCRTDNFSEYFNELAMRYNPVTLGNVMCRTTISVGCDGLLYDCDFNQMLGLPVSVSGYDHINDFDYSKLNRRGIVIRNHCYACTAGSGSSCQGCVD